MEILIDKTKELVDNDFCIIKMNAYNLKEFLDYLKKEVDNDILPPYRIIQDILDDFDKKLTETNF